MSDYKNEQWGAQQGSYQPQYQPGPTPTYAPPPTQPPYQQQTGYGDDKSPFEGDRFNPKTRVNDPFFLIFFILQVRPPAPLVRFVVLIIFE
jgi:hypothetical protein